MSKVMRTGYQIATKRRADVGPLGLVSTGGRQRKNQRRRLMRRTVCNAVFAALLLFTGSMAIAGHGKSVANVPSRVAVTVQTGDTLWKLAHRYGDPNRYILERVDELANENNLTADSVLQPGQSILVPVHSAEDYMRISEKVATL